MLEEPVKVFVYSELQIDEEKEVCKKVGRIFACGSIAIGHTRDQYSKIINESELDAMSNRYPDTKIIFRGKLSNVKYTPVTREYIKEADTLL